MPRIVKEGSDTTSVNLGLNKRKTHRDILTELGYYIYWTSAIVHGCELVHSTPLGL